MQIQFKIVAELLSTDTSYFLLPCFRGPDCNLRYEKKKWFQANSMRDPIMRRRDDICVEMDGLRLVSPEKRDIYLG